MIPIIAAIAAVAVVGAVIITFWDEIKQALKSAITKAKEVIRKLVQASMIGFTTYLKTGSVRQGALSIFKFYSKDAAGQYHETTVTKQVTESELPDSILEKLKQHESGQEVDISEELQLEMG